MTDDHHGPHNSGDLLEQTVISRVGQTEHFGGQGRIAFNDPPQFGRGGPVVTQGFHQTPDHIGHGRQTFDLKNTAADIRGVRGFGLNMPGGCFHRVVLTAGAAIMTVGRIVHIKYPLNPCFVRSPGKRLEDRAP